MKNWYRQNNHAQRPSYRIAAVSIVLAIAAVIGIDALSGGLVRALVRGTSGAVTNRVATVFSAVEESGVLRTRTSLATENAQLREQIERESEARARYDALAAENAALYEIARLVEPLERAVSVRVLSSFRASPYGTFHIAGGARDGLSAGNVVMTPGGFMLGTISDVGEYTASVHALFAPGREVQLTAGEVSFLARGRGSGNALADVPRGALLQVGDVVLSTESGGRPAGVIERVENDASSATERVYVRVPVNLDVITFVYVIPQ